LFSEVKTVLLSHLSNILQAMAFKPILEGQSCIVADQTGSGKTLAYLAPLVQMLRAEEGKSQTKQLSKKPRFLVLVPTSELAVQVGTFDCFCVFGQIRVNIMPSLFTANFGPLY